MKRLFCTIIALLLCGVMKDSLAGFIEVIVSSMTEKAKEILTGPAAGTLGFLAGAKL